MGSTCRRANALDLVLGRAQSHLGAAPPPGLRRRNRVILGSFEKLAGLALFAICVALLMVSQTPATADEAQTKRIRIEYVPPTNPAHETVYALLKERRALEKLQEIFSPFRLPIDLTLKAMGCDGVSNAWYHRPSVTLCYEYLDEIHRSVPEKTTPEGVTPQDAEVGQLFYVVAHEIGHAMFDYLDIPVFGRQEDAADQFSTYMMLHFGKDDALRLIKGAAYSYRNYVHNPNVTVPLQAFADVHGAPMQRFYNLLCIAYGADPILFEGFVAEEHLPKGRANDCEHEYNEARFAFRTLIVPHLDEQLAKQVLDKALHREVIARPARN